MLKLEFLRAFIFDFDGTLALLNIDFSLMRQQVMDLSRYFGVDGELIKEPHLLEIIDEIHFIIRRRSPTAGAHFYESAHRVIREIELQAAGEGRLLSGAEDTLRTLRRKGMKVGIVTRNCEEAVRKVFPGVDDHCDVFIPRDSVKKVKPDPEHLSAVLRALNVSGEEAVMVGDHTIDIEAGKKLGMKTIGVTTGRINREQFEKAGADYILREASEIGQLLEE